MARKLLPKQYAKILFELTDGVSKKDLDSRINLYFKFLKSEQVLSKLPYIIDEFIRYAKQKAGINTISIECARQLSEGEAKAIAAYFGKNTEYNVQTNTKLLGGVKIKHNNTIIDASLRSQLEALKTRMS